MILKLNIAGNLEIPNPGWGVVRNLQILMKSGSSGPQESTGNLEICPHKSIGNPGKSHKILPKFAKSIGKLAKPHDFDWFSYYYC